MILSTSKTFAMPIQYWIFIILHAKERFTKLFKKRKLNVGYLTHLCTFKSWILNRSKRLRDDCTVYSYTLTLCGMLHCTCTVAPKQLHHEHRCSARIFRLELCTHKNIMQSIIEIIWWYSRPRMIKNAPRNCLWILIWSFEIWLSDWRLVIRQFQVSNILLLAEILVLRLHVESHVVGEVEWNN